MFAGVWKTDVTSSCPALLFFYLFFKLGVCQCIGKAVCKMYCSACKAYWSVLRCMTCFFWHKLTNVKRINRRRRHRQHFPDIETNESSTSSRGSSLFADRDVGVSRKKRKLITKEMESNRHHNRHRHRHRHHHHKINKKQVDVQVKGRSLKLNKLKHHQHPRKNTGIRRTETTSFKRRRLV